ncbi:hypothetical protein [Microbacterium flavum]|uniref:hypothetical protein n=1 Tax=Microbacterium flavum TaxID=415216 RepID=UPI0024AD65C2|nr:hypothetical protein [Microbacterium flavum]
MTSPRIPSFRKRALAAVAAAAALVVGAVAGPLAAPASAATGSWTTETIAGMSVRLYTPASAPPFPPAAPSW